MSKLTSRKFWICVASFLGSIGTSIAGFQTDNEVAAIVGIICATFSAAIYSACEAAVDKAGAGADVYIASSEMAALNESDTIPVESEDEE